MTWLENLWSYLPSSFAAGFVTGALIFAYWDNIMSFIRRMPKIEAPEEPKQDFRAWIGCMRPNFDCSQRTIDLWVSIINVGDASFRLKKPEGHVILRAGRSRYRLTSPRFSTASEDLHSRGAYSTLAIRFDVPPKLWDSYPDMFQWNNPRTHLELSELSVQVEAEDGAVKSIHGWESMRLTAGEEEVRSVQTFPIARNEEERRQLTETVKALNEAAEILRSRDGPH